MSNAQFTVTVPEINVSGFRASAIRSMRNWGGKYIETLTSQRMSGRPGTNRRTGNLARGWNSAVTEETGGAVLRIWVTGPGAQYAAMQEFGGTQTPKRSKYLWIPIAGNVTGTGVARISPREAINRGGFFHGGVFFGLALTKSKVPQRSQAIGGAGYKGTTLEKGANITPLFALKKSVRIPARLGARAHFASKQLDLYTAIFNASRVIG